MQRAKIVATLGPASSDRETVSALIEAGMDVARLNFSHGTHEDHARAYQLVREEAERARRGIAVLQDLQGPKIRVTGITEPIELVPGARFRLVGELVEADERQASLTYDRLHEEAAVGEQVMLDDGLMHLRIVGIGDGWVDTEVLVGGTLQNKKGVNLPDTSISAPSLTAKDKADLEFGLGLGVDYVALSFVRSGLDIHQLRAYLPDAEDAPQIIAKIEKPQAVRAMREVVGAADGIMVARGDLGVEMAPERVPVIQKQLLELASQLGKVTITATQMLDSMTVNPRPTRAEASDVANAIYDGTDAVMLSGETAAGRYPVETVRLMTRIIAQAESSPFFRRPTSSPGDLMRHDLNSIARAVRPAAEALDVSVIATFTMTGRTPKLIKAYRPRQTVLAFTPRHSTYCKLALHRGITPILTEPVPDAEDQTGQVERWLLDHGLARPGEFVLIVMAIPAGEVVPANLIKYHRMPG